jgi:hypothetical protein
VESVNVRCSPQSLSCTDTAGSLTNPTHTVTGHPVDEKGSIVSHTTSLFIYRVRRTSISVTDLGRMR